MTKKVRKHSKTFDKNIGFKSVARKKGYSKIKLKIGKQHLNHGGIVHGGVLATLCDSTLANAVTSEMKKDQWCVTIQLTIEYMEPAFLGETLYGYGKLVRKGKTIAFVEGGIETKGKKKVAKASGIWFIKTGPSKKVHVSKPVKRMD